MIQLRAATTTDADDVAAIYIESWNKGFGHLLGYREHTVERTDRWHSDLVNRENEWTVAVVDGRLSGFVGVGPSRDPVDSELGELLTIAVDPGAWRRGVGAALIDHGVAQLRATRSSAILWTPAGYERGHGFYRAMGWRELGRSRAAGTEVAFGRPL